MAPPEPSKLWQAVQLVRKIWPPRTTASSRSSSVMPAVLYCSSVGIAGPGPRVATYAASASISSWL